MADPIVVHYSLLDAQGVRVPAQFYVGDAALGLTGTAFIAAAVTFGTIVQNISDAKMTGGEIRIPITADAGWKANPVNFSHVGDAGLFQFGQANSKYTQSAVVPAIGTSVLDSANGIDLEDAAVKAFINAILAGTDLAANFRVVSKFDNAIDTFLGCEYVDRTHRRQVKGKTYRSGANYAA